MMMVRCILVDTTVPVRIRPRMETRPVKGHFLSVEGLWSVLDRRPDWYLIRLVLLDMLANSFEPHNCFAQPQVVQEFAHTDVLALNGGLGGTETQTNILVPSSLYKSSVVVVLYSSQLGVRRGGTHATLAGTLGLALGDKRNVRLLLESTLRLDGQLGSHVCGGSCRSQRKGDGSGAILSAEGDVKFRSSDLKDSSGRWV